MPNHVTNVVSFNGDKQDIIKLLKSIGNSSNEDGNIYIDFNKIVKRPEAYNNTVSSTDQEYNVALYKAQVDKDFVKIDDILTYSWVSNEGITTREELIEMLEKRGNSAEKGKIYVELTEKYGYSDWYSWSINNWGTKWNAYSQSFENDILSFDTAWSGVPNLMLELSKKNPNVEISYKYADEDYGANVGRFIFKNGNILFEEIPNIASKEAYEIAEEVHGFSLSEYYGEEG